MGEVNRRLAGILAADVVGYSAMVGADEPGTLARVRTLRTGTIEPLAGTHGGRLFKTTGDGFFVEFASTVQALRCAAPSPSRARCAPGPTACGCASACTRARWCLRATT
jgi:class 3 adenylate cyclase